MEGRTGQNYFKLTSGITCCQLAVNVLFMRSLCVNYAKHLLLICTSTFYFPLLLAFDLSSNTWRESLGRRRRERE
uniref:Uncharacterized protein n=1 Tax=Anguilla anguilla TaxID=7936 RepID=A0A0E9W5B7_ANGAN